MDVVGRAGLRSELLTSLQNDPVRYSFKRGIRWHRRGESDVGLKRVGTVSLEDGNVSRGRAVDVGAHDRQNDRLIACRSRCLINIGDAGGGKLRLGAVKSIGHYDPPRATLKAITSLMVTEPPAGVAKDSTPLPLV